MIRHGDKIAGAQRLNFFVIITNSSGGIRNYHLFDAEQLEYANRICRLPHLPAFIIMKSSFHSYNSFSLKSS